jgi:hypothetical protein
MSVSPLTVKELDTPVPNFTWDMLTRFEPVNMTGKPLLLVDGETEFMTNGDACCIAAD